jgi:hypothetical protein
LLLRARQAPSRVADDFDIDDADRDVLNEDRELLRNTTAPTDNLFDVMDDVSGPLTERERFILETQGGSAGDGADDDDADLGGLAGKHRESILSFDTAAGTGGNFASAAVHSASRYVDSRTRRGLLAAPPPKPTIEQQRRRREHLMESMGQALSASAADFFLRAVPLARAAAEGRTDVAEASLESRYVEPCPDLSRVVALWANVAAAAPCGPATIVPPYVPRLDPHGRQYPDVHDALRQLVTLKKLAQEEEAASATWTPLHLHRHNVAMTQRQVRLRTEADMLSDAAESRRLDREQACEAAAIHATVWPGTSEGAPPQGTTFNLTGGAVSGQSLVSGPAPSVGRAMQEGDQLLRTALQSLGCAPAAVDAITSDNHHHQSPRATHGASPTTANTASTTAHDEARHRALHRLVLAQVVTKEARALTALADAKELPPLPSAGHTRGPSTSAPTSAPAKKRSATPTEWEHPVECLWLERLDVPFAPERSQQALS